jgi:HEAT repeat protein
MRNEEDSLMPEEIEVLLADLYASQKEMRAKAAHMLGEAGVRALPGLLRAVGDPNWVVRYRAVEALTAIPDSCIDPVLITSLGDERDHVRYIAAKGLGIRKVSQAVLPLIQALGDENEFVRMSVARSLAVLENPAAIPPLREKILREVVGRVAEEMKKALARLEQCYRTQNA